MHLISMYSFLSGIKIVKTLAGILLVYKAVFKALLDDSGELG